MYIFIGTIIGIICLLILAIPIFNKKILEKEIEQQIFLSKNKSTRNNILNEVRSDYEAGYISDEKFNELNLEINEEYENDDS
ncbi:MAG: hypothetical protein QF496_02550 [Dehalococcoidia bacterium]|jgi:uncharacterized membrane protein|nr:hypothetical protein [Dehalococcoidia bacterium]